MPIIDAIAIDLDGTLLGPDGRVSERDRAAVERARDAGVTVIVCTGRGLAECRGALASIAQLDPVVVAGGSIVACPATGRTLHRALMPAGVVRAAVDVFHANACPALVLKDPHGLDYDYLVLHSDRNHPLDPTISWWFGEHALRVRTGVHVHHDEHPGHTVRVGMCAPGATSGSAARAVRRELGEGVVMHDFAAVHPSHHEGEPVHILELFSPQATKWGGVGWVCAGRGLDPARVAAIGDEVNDLTMIEGAGLSVAMGNAVESVRRAADYQTGTNERCGVAEAIDNILSGLWTPRCKAAVP